MESGAASGTSSCSLSQTGYRPGGCEPPDRFTRVDDVSQDHANPRAKCTIAIPVFRSTAFHLATTRSPCVSSGRFAAAARLLRLPFAAVDAQRLRPVRGRAWPAAILARPRTGRSRCASLSSNVRPLVRTSCNRDRPRLSARGFPALASQLQIHTDLLALCNCGILQARLSPRILAHSKQAKPLPATQRWRRLPLTKEE